MHVFLRLLCRLYILYIVPESKALSVYSLNSLSFDAFRKKAILFLAGMLFATAVENSGKCNKININGNQ